jgi:hypothetical protein
MCKLSLKFYEKLSSSSDKLRMRPDFHVKSAPHVFSHNASIHDTGACKNIKANNAHSGITFENEYKGHEHYTTTYNKTTQPKIIDDMKYETTLVDFKFIKDDSGINELTRVFVEKIMTKFAGQTAIRRSFRLLNIAGTGVISHDEFTASLHMLGIWIYTTADFNLFYTKLAGDIHKMITYMSFKAFIEEQNEFTRCCEL